MPERLARVTVQRGRPARQAAQAGAARLLLTHLWPGTDHATARAAAAEHYDGDLGVAAPGVVADL